MFFYLSVSFPSTHPIAVVITYKDMALMLSVSSRLNSVTHHFTTHEKNHSVIGLNNRTSMCPQYVHHSWNTLGCEIIPQSNVFFFTLLKDPKIQMRTASVLLRPWGLHPLRALPWIPCFLCVCQIAWVFGVSLKTTSPNVVSNMACGSGSLLWLEHAIPPSLARN